MSDKHFRLKINSNTSATNWKWFVESHSVTPPEGSRLLTGTGRVQINKALWKFKETKVKEF